MPNTYVALATQTLGSAAASVTFSSIPATYTDLVLITSVQNNSGGNRAMQIILNADTATNYSGTYLTGDGSTAASGRSTSVAYLDTFATVPGAEFGTCIFNFQNYANTTTFKTVVSRSGSAGTNARTAASLWRSTAAINSIKFQLGGADLYSTGSTFSLYGIANADQGAAKATGGIITEDATYWYHTFAASGTFTPKQSITADMLVIAGGGGGGAEYGQSQACSGGGGGAGGLLGFSSQSLTATGYTVTVGGGGAGGSAGKNKGALGGDSQFGALTLVKGGGGGGYNYDGAGSTSGMAGLTGGSGGGAGGTYTGAYVGSGGSATSGQGYAGGGGTGTRCGGGGGGAGVAGTAAADNNIAGAGGNGLSTYSSWGLATGTGQNVSGTYYYAGGGGGGMWDTTNITLGAGGYGGGASGNVYGTAGSNAMAFTGGGGSGASASTSTSLAGGNGGSGLVIVRYAK